MKRLAGLILIVLAFAFAAQAAEHAYVGVKKCAMCHKGQKGGMTFEKWKEMKHAKTWELLGTERAMEVYTELGHEGNPQEDPQCLKCHVTGYEDDASLTLKIKKENGVGCESCHGAGGDYAKKPIMKSHDKAVAKGMVDKASESCKKCHNKNSPTFKPFDFEERWKKIEHGRPPKKAAKK